MNNFSSESQSSNDQLKTKAIDNPSECSRQDIIEQAGSPTIRIIIDSHTFILPYAFFVRAECHVREDEFLIIAYFTTMTVTIQGRHLAKLAQLLAEYRLLSIILRTEIANTSELGDPFIERILVAVREGATSRDKTAKRGRKIVAESVGRP